MRREDETRRVLLLHLAHQGDDLGAGVAVEVRSRLVRQHHRGPLHERPRDRDALLLSAAGVWLGRWARLSMARPTDSSIAMVLSLHTFGGGPAEQDHGVFDVLVGREHRAAD